MGRQGQSRAAQVHAMYLSDQKGYSQDPPLPRAHLRVGSEGEGVLLEIPLSLRPCEGKSILSFISVPTAVAFEHVLLCCSLGLCYYAVIAMLPVVLQRGSSLTLERKSPGYFCKVSCRHPVNCQLY